MARFDDLKHFMDTTIPELGVSGIDCIIYQHHQMIFRHASGYSDIENQIPMQPDALYNLYSASKMITCVAALQLVENGKMLLTDPLHAYLPEFKEMKVKHGTFVIKPAKRPIRIVDLFTMTAGLSYELDTPEMRKLIADTGGDFNTRDFAAALAREPLMFDPGDGWNYSYCHDVLGAVIEAISGMSLGDYLKANLFDPLGMKDAGFYVPADKRARIAPQYEYSHETRSVRRIDNKCIGQHGLRHESGGGGLIMSADDYMRFADALACGGIGMNGAKIISESAINLLRSNQLKDKTLQDFRTMVPSEGIGYGLGVSVVMDRAAAYRLVPNHAFSWGGLGGVQVFIDPSNRLSYFVAQHTIRSPKELLEPKMLNIVYASL